MELIKIILSVLIFLITGIILTFLICASIIKSEIEKQERKNNKE